MSGAVQKITIKDYMSAPAVQKKMQEMLVSPQMVRQFTTSVISIAGSDQLLAESEPRSLFNACLTAASLNLPINKNLGFAHIIGYKNTRAGVTEAQFQLGARGFKELAQRSGKYKFINQGDVREGEMGGRNRLTGQIDFNWEQDEAKRLKLPIIGYFSYFELHNGFTSTLYMSKEEVTAHGKQYSQAFKKGFGPWKDNFEAMALKTVSKLNISKNGPLSVELETAIASDQAVIRDNGQRDYIDGEEALNNEKADEEERAAILAAQTDKSTGEIHEDADDTKKK
jgi:recombination protein RecT